MQSVLKKYSYRSITDIVNEAAKMARKSGRSEIEKEDNSNNISRIQGN